MLKRVNSINSH